MTQTNNEATTIKVRGIDVEIDFSDANEWREGIASHTVKTADLRSGPTDGPNDGEIIIVNDQPFRLGEHEYVDYGSDTVCTAEMMALDDEELSDWKDTDEGRHWQAGR